MNDGEVAPASLLRGLPRSGALEGVAGQLRPIVVVLGVRHGGASLFSHVRGALGVDIADRAAPELAGREPDDMTGDWERSELTDLRERILGLFDRGCDTRCMTLPFRLPDGPFRAQRLLPAWDQLFGERDGPGIAQSAGIGALECGAIEVIGDAR